MRQPPPTARRRISMRALVVLFVLFMPHAALGFGVSPQPAEIPIHFVWWGDSRYHEPAEMQSMVDWADNAWANPPPEIRGRIEAALMTGFEIGPGSARPYSTLEAFAATFQGIQNLLWVSLVSHSGMDNIPAVGQSSGCFRDTNDGTCETPTWRSSVCVVNGCSGAPSVGTTMSSVGFLSQPASASMWPFASS